MIFPLCKSTLLQNPYSVSESFSQDATTGSLPLSSVSSPDWHDLYYLHPGAPCGSSHNQWHTTSKPFHARIRPQSGNDILRQLRWHARKDHRRPSIRRPFYLVRWTAGRRHQQLQTGYGAVGQAPCKLDQANRKCLTGSRIRLGS